MSYSPPNFNLDYRLWRRLLNYLNGEDPALEGVCQLRAPNKSLQMYGDINASETVKQSFWSAVFPAGEDIRDFFQVAGSAADVIEIPAGTNRMYKVIQVDDAAKGFPNEYRIAILEKERTRAGNYWPTPIP